MAESEKLKSAAADPEQPKEEPPNDEQTKAARRPFWEKPVSPTESEKAAAKAEKRTKRRAEKEKEDELKDKEAELKWGREAEARAIKAGRPPGAPKLPEGKGRPKRFASRRLNSGRPFIERNIAPIVKDKPPVPAVPPVPALIPKAEPTVDPQPEPTPPTDDDDDKKLSPLDTTVAAPIIEKRLPVSPPGRPPRPMRLANDKDAVTLHHVLRVVNDALRAEMGRDPEVHAALAQEIQGPLRVLDDLGRLVRLLFLSMDKHREQLWREKKAALRAAKEAAESNKTDEADEVDETNETEEKVVKAVIKSIRRKPWFGAASVFSTPICEFVPRPRDKKGKESEQEQQPKDDDGDDEADEDEENKDEDENEGDEGDKENDVDSEDGGDEKDGDEKGDSKKKNEKKSEEEEREKKKKEDDDDETLYFLMGPAFFGNGVSSDDDDVDDDNDNPDSDKSDLILQGFQRADDRKANILRSRAAIKRDHGTVFHDPDDSDELMSDSESEVEPDDKYSWDYLKNRSPSLGSKFPKLELMLDPLDPRRHGMFGIEERRFEEAVENKKIRLAAREALCKARDEAQANIDAANANHEAELAEVRSQAYNAATEAVKKQLADLEDERDAALQLAKAAVYERDEVDAGREDREREMDQLRTLVRELIDREFVQSDEEDEGKERKSSEKDDEKKKESTEEKENVEEDVEEKQGEVEEKGKGAEEGKKEETTKNNVVTKDRESEADPTETDPLPELPTEADFMGRASRRSSRHFNHSSVPSDIPMPPLTPFAPTTPIFLNVPPTPSTPMAKWDRQRLIDEVERILRATVPPPTPMAQQFNQRPPPPSPAPRRRTSTKKDGAAYHIKRVRAPLGDGFLSSFFDILLAILLLVTRQKSNSKTVGTYIWYKYAMPTYLPLKKLVLRIEDRFLSSRRQPQPPSQSTNISEGETNLTGQPFATTPAPFTTSIASQHNKRSRTALATMYRHDLHRAYFVFPRDAIAELFVFVFVTFAGFCLASAIRERNLWLDANNTATDPAWYLYYLLRYKQEMASYTASTATPPSFGPGSHHICACLPTFVDTRMITWPLAYMWNVWRDRVQDYMLQTRLASRSSVGWF